LSLAVYRYRRIAAGISLHGPLRERMQAVGEPKVRKAITQSAQPFNLADDIYFMRNHFTFFITEIINKIFLKI
jgi:hypothetical protein